MPDVIITPFSGRMDFSQTEAGTSIASIVLDSSNSDLTLTTTSGNLVIGDASRDVYIGNGVANVDIVFEQDGEIRGLTNKTITIGQTDSFVDFRTSKTTFSTGNVSIGTITPSGKLHVRDDSLNATLIIEDRLSSTDPFIRFIPSATNVSFSVGIDDSDSDKFKLSFGANNTGVLGTNDYLIVTTGGNVGIANTNPTNKLDIVGNARVSGNLYVTGNQKQLIVSTTGFPIGSDYACMKADGGNYTTLGQFGGFYFQDRTPLGSGWQWYSAGGILKLYDHTSLVDRWEFTSGGNFTLNASNRFFWDNSNQRFGIRQSNPTSSLHLGGSHALPIRVVTTNYTPTETDAVILASGSLNIVLPDASSSPGRVYYVKSLTVNTVSFTGSVSQIDNNATGPALSTQNAGHQFISNGTGWFIISNKN